MKVIRTEADYDIALKRMEVLMDAVPGTSDADDLDVLSLLVEAYEKKQYPIGMPTPVEAVEFFMDQNGLKKADMVQYMGSPSKVSEVLRGKRSLSKAMICKLVEGLGIPAEILLGVTPSADISGYVVARYENRCPAKTYAVEKSCSDLIAECSPCYEYNVADESYALAA